MISDTHFSHENILKFTDDTGNLIRPGFADTREMDEHMVECWNKVVNEGDYVYHLGDVTFGSKDNFKKLWPRLKGSKRLIVGNHDDIKWLACGGFFKKVSMWRIFKEFDMVLTHVPLHSSSFRKVRFNTHGHIHEKSPPTGQHYCVSVEQIAYTPIHIEQVRDELR